MNGRRKFVERWRWGSKSGEKFNGGDLMKGRGWMGVVMRRRWDLRRRAMRLAIGFKGCFFSRESDGK